MATYRLSAASAPNLGITLFYVGSSSLELCQLLFLENSASVGYGSVKMTVGPTLGNIAWMAAAQWNGNVCLLYKYLVGQRAGKNDILFATSQPSSVTLQDFFNDMFAAESKPPPPDLVWPWPFFQNPWPQVNSVGQWAPLWSGGVPIVQGPQKISMPRLAVIGQSILGIFTGNLNQIYLTSSTDGINWKVSSIYGALSATTPSVAVFKDSLYVLFRSSSDYTMFVLCSSDYGGTWTTLHLPAAITTAGSPALVATDDALYGIFNSTTDNTLWSINSEDGQNWNLNQPPTITTTDRWPTATVYDNIIFLFFGNSSGSISMTSSMDGDNWTTPTALSKLYT